MSTLCGVCANDTLDACAPTLCPDCCPHCADPVARAIAALAALTVHDIGPLAERLDVDHRMVGRFAARAGAEHGSPVEAAS